jgi:hypothetical protein
MWGNDTPVECFLAQKPDEMWKHLEGTNLFVQEGLPREVGGMWQQDRFEAWFQHQQSKSKVADRKVRKSGGSLTLLSRKNARQGLKNRMDSLFGKPESQTMANSAEFPVQ